MTLAVEGITGTGEALRQAVMAGGPPLLPAMAVTPPNPLSTFPFNLTL